MSGCCTVDPDRLTLVLENRATSDERGLYGGRDRIRALLAQLAAFVDDDSNWDPADHIE